MPMIIDLRMIDGGASTSWKVEGKAKLLFGADRQGREVVRVNALAGWDGAPCWLQRHSSTAHDQVFPNKFHD